MSRELEFFFDVGSPASYLAWTQAPGLCRRTGATLRYRPMLLGGVFKATGNASPAAVPAKGRYSGRDMQRFARRYGVTLNQNPHFPVNTLMAMRLARAYTGKNKVIKLRDHFHGWHDYVTPESGQALGGVPEAVLGTVIVSPADISALDRILSNDNDVAAVIVECNGAHYGTHPLQNPQFLHDLQETTAKHGVVFIMDEVITGFRLSSGGAQGRWNLEPDLTTMAKIIAGGQPGAAVGGRADIMELMSFRDDPEWDSVGRVPQGGTFNAQPVTAAAGTATLHAIATQGVNARADAMALRLKDGLNEAFIQNEVTGHAHGIASIVHINLGAECDCDRGLCAMPYEHIYQTMPQEMTRAMRRVMLVNGVDMMGGRAFLVSSAHEEEVIDRTLEAFSASLKELREEGVV